MKAFGILTVLGLAVSTHAFSAPVVQSISLADAVKQKHVDVVSADNKLADYVIVSVEKGEGETLTPQIIDSYNLDCEVVATHTIQETGTQEIIIALDHMNLDDGYNRCEVEVIVEEKVGGLYTFTLGYSVEP